VPAPYFGLFAPLKPPDSLRQDRESGPSLWLRLRVRRKRRELDAALADGANPETSDELALRSQQLQEPATRLQLARQIENIYRLATDGPGSQASTAMSAGAFNGFRVAANRPVLEALAARLRSKGPLNLRGLALCSVLVEDTSSPLYARTEVDELEPAVRRATSALVP
jgi:hypothetical protein